jgi:hypothetical protein
MAKDSYYFPHDYNARNDEKILELRANFGAEGYGVFWMIIETMAENDYGGVKASLIGGLSLGYGVAKEKLLGIIELCLSIGLLNEKDGYYFSNRLLEYKKFRKSQVEFGKLGATKRWGGYGGAISGANGGSNANERKGKEIKEKKERGVKFSDDMLSVIFADGSSQILGEGQIKDLKRNNLSPNSLIKGFFPY